MAAPRKRVRVQRLDAHIMPEHLDWLRTEAQRLDVSVSELLRRLIEQAARRRR